MATINYTTLFSKLAMSRKPSPLRQMWEEVGEDISGYINMGGGLPNEDCFPIKSMSLKLADGSDLEIDEATTLQAMQYGRTPGQYELLKWVMTLLKILHDPPTLRDSIHPGKLEVVITSGAQDGLYKICEALVEEDDTIFTEAPTYSSFMAAIRPFRCKLIPVEMDENGLIPEKLSMVLSDHLTRKNGKLKFLYCVPNGGNPSGFRYTEDRKRKIYELARKYNLLIVEDDAYFFLEIKPYTPSFLSMDVDGRVIRIDTFSKSIAPGLRTAFLSGPKPIVEKVIMAMQASNSSCAVTSQVILLAILKRMGHDGYLRHCETLADLYKRRRDLCIKAAEKHLNGLAEWHTPSGGMFLWIKIKDTKDAYKIVDEKLKFRRILMVPGVCFNTDERVSSAHIRISYSKVSEEYMDKYAIKMHGSCKIRADGHYSIDGAIILTEEKRKEERNEQLLAFGVIEEELRKLATKAGKTQDLISKERTG